MKSKTTTSEKKEYWKNLRRKQKVQYVWDYYKFPIAVALIFFYIIGYTICGHFGEKDILLYTGLINISAGEDLTGQLSDGFLDYSNKNPDKHDLQLYTGLYLTNNPNDPNHEYAASSRIKLLASIDGEQLDVVLMTKEVFDAFSQNGYLVNLEELLRASAPGDFAELKPYLVTNKVISENNSEDLLTDDSLSYHAVSSEYPMGLNVSQKGLFKQAGFEDDVFLGVIGNSPRTDMAVNYIRYLYSQTRP